MIHRRRFLAWIAALPVLGRVVPKTYFDVPDGYDSFTMNTQRGVESLPDKSHRNIARLIESSLNANGEHVDSFHVVTDGTGSDPLCADGLPQMSGTPFQGPVKILEAISKRCEWIVTATYRSKDA